MDSLIVPARPAQDSDCRANTPTQSCFGTQDSGVLCAYPGEWLPFELVGQFGEDNRAVRYALWTRAPMLFAGAASDQNWTVPVQILSHCSAEKGAYLWSVEALVCKGWGLPRCLPQGRTCAGN
jgi:hypothetical protein